MWQVCRSDKSDSTPEKKLFHNINMLGVTAPTLEMPGTCFQSYVLLTFFVSIEIYNIDRTLRALIG